MTAAVVVVIGGSLAWVYSHNQKTFFPASHAAATPTPTPAVYTFSVSATQDSPGLDTKIDVPAGSKLTITAQGTASYGPDIESDGCPEETNPDGGVPTNASCSTKLDSSATLPSAPIGELLACIAQPGASFSTCWFAAGSHYSSTVSTGGRLYLIYNDDPGQYYNNGGSYQVTVTIAPA